VEGRRAVLRAVRGGEGGGSRGMNCGAIRSCTENKQRFPWRRRKDDERSTALSICEDRSEIELCPSTGPV
jgi:hypothetical protein